MGAEESRNGNYGLMGASAVVANMNLQAQKSRPWSLLHQCSLDQWKSGHAGANRGRFQSEIYISEYLINFSTINVAISETCLSSHNVIGTIYNLSHKHFKFVFGNIIGLPCYKKNHQKISIFIFHL